MVRPLQYFLALSFCAFSSGVHAQLPAEPPKIVGKLAIDEKFNAIPVSAGIVCLPKGKMKAADLLGGDDFGTSLGSSLLKFLEIHPEFIWSDKFSELSVYFKGVSGKICNKSFGVYGLGNRNSFVGEISFKYEWIAHDSRGDVRSGLTSVGRSYSGSNAASISQMYRNSIDDLLIKIFDPEL